MYGTSHSGKFWDNDLKDWMLGYGFITCPSDRSLYILRKKTEWLFVINYIDDQLYFGSSRAFEEQFERDISKRFNLNLLGDIHWYLQARINRRDNGDITLDQSRYCIHIANKYLNDKSYDNSKVRDTPLPPGLKLSKSWSKDKKGIESFETLDYRSCIGSLIYLTMATRYDIIYAVTKLAKFVNDPGTKHFAALVWLLQYLKGNNNIALIYYHDYSHSPVFKLYKMEVAETEKAKWENGEIPTTITFTDSSWQDCPDTGKSTCSYVILHQGGIIDYGSSLTTPISMSTMESEYFGASKACIAFTH